MPDLHVSTIELPPLSVRATLSSINDDSRTVDLVFATGAPVTRYSWDGPYIEKLSMDPAHIRLDRLNAGAPLLNTHSGYDLSDQLGVVEDDTAKIVGKKGLATVRFSKRADVEPFWQDVKDRIIRNVSVGYLVHRYEEAPGKKDGPPTRTAVDWEPYEISMVPMPADAGAQTRDGKSQVRTHPCLITRGAEPGNAPQQESVMPEETPETIVERSPLETAAPVETRAATKPEPTDSELGKAAERERITGITAACRAARMPAEFMDRLIDGDTPLVKAQAMVFEEMRKRGGENSGPQSGAVADIRLTNDPLLHVRGGIQDALLNRVSPQLFPMTDKGREYRGMTLIEVARVFLNARGIRTTSMSKADLAGVALGLNERAGYHTTSDFPELLADVANKTLRKAYDESPQTYTTIARQITVGDFKQINMAQFGDAPALLEVKEHGEFTRGTIVDSKELFALKTYGRIFAVTRQALINDDVDAFSRVPMMFGRQARALESDLIWAQITSNPTMGDGNALFSAAHANLETDGDHITIDSLSRARKSIRVQKGLDATTRLNLTPKYLLVPPSLETKAQQFVGQITPATAANANPFSGLLQVVSEPRLEDNSVTAWYMVADGSQMDVVVYAYLEGQSGPSIEQRIGFNVDGLEIKARHDFAALVVDWRGIHKDPGDLDS